MRAENFSILRRKPIEGYHISFLITNIHIEQMLKHKLIDFIIEVIWPFPMLVIYTNYLTKIRT